MGEATELAGELRSKCVGSSSQRLCFGSISICLDRMLGV